MCRWWVLAQVVDDGAAGRMTKEGWCCSHSGTWGTMCMMRQAPHPSLPIASPAHAPQVQARYSVSCDPAKVAFGGGSFAGVAALYAALHYPHVFGAVLAESPSLWVAEGRFLQVRPRCAVGEGCSTRLRAASWPGEAAAAMC